MPKLMTGDKLSIKTREQVLRTFIYRHTHENERHGGCAICRTNKEGLTIKTDAGEVPWHDFHTKAILDEQWLVEHAFYVNKDGSLSKSHKYCELAFMANGG